MLYYYLALLFIIGSVLGSFLSVVISRFETGEGFIFGRSKCPQCKKKIRYYDLAPVFSFFVLKGRCRDCKEKISFLYPVVEVVSGLLLALLYLRFYGEFSVEAFYVFFIFYALIFLALFAIAFLDGFYFIVPDKIAIPAIVIALIASLINAIFGFDFLVYAPGIANVFWGALAGGGLFLLLVLISKEKWMGWGDVKLGLLIGLVLGLPLTIIALFGAFILGSLVGVGLIWAGKKKKKDAIQFAPFLVVGALIALFLGKYILVWYLG